MGSELKIAVEKICKYRYGRYPRFVQDAYAEIFAEPIPGAKAEQRNLKLRTKTIQMLQGMGTRNIMNIYRRTMRRKLEHLKGETSYFKTWDRFVDIALEYSERSERAFLLDREIKFRSK